MEHRVKAFRIWDCGLLIGEKAENSEAKMKNQKANTSFLLAPYLF